MTIVRPVGGPGVRNGLAVYNVKDYGAKGDGATNDTTAINAAISAMPAIAGSFSAASGVLYFPAGRYITAGGHVIASGKRTRVVGDGEYNTILYRATGSAADMFTINAQYSGVELLTFDGNYGAAGSGDGLVLNAAYSYARSADIANFTGNGITIGKASGAITHILDNLHLKYNQGYGIQVVTSSGSTDGMWSNVNVGNSGLSAIRIQTGAQNLSNVHVWGSGIRSSTDNHGIWINSSANNLVNFESETNMGHGILIAGAGSNSNSIIGGDLWGNAGNGIYSFGPSNRMVIQGVRIRNNGVANTAGSSSAAFAGIRNESGLEWVVSGNQIFDDGTAVAAGSYGSFSTTFSFAGRSGIFTQSAHYAETNTGGGAPDRNVITGNVMRKELSRTGVSYILLGTSNRFAHNNTGATAAPTVASASAVTLPADCDFIEVTGTTAITSITAGYAGRRVTLRFSNASPGQVTDGNNLALAGSFTPTTDDTLSLACDGTNWYETGRSAN